MQSMCVYFVTKGLSNVSFVVVSAVFELVMSSIRSCDVTYFEYSGWCDCELCMICEKLHQSSLMKDTLPLFTRPGLHLGKEFRTPLY